MNYGRSPNRKITVSPFSQHKRGAAQSDGIILINGFSRSSSAQTNELLTCKVSITTVFVLSHLAVERFYSFGAMPFLPIKRVKEPKYPSFDGAYAVIQTPWVAYSTHRSDLPYAKIFSTAIRHFAFFTCDGAAKTFLPFYASWTSRRARGYARRASWWTVVCMHLGDLSSAAHITRAHDAKIKASEKVAVKHTSNGRILQSSALHSRKSHKVDCFSLYNKSQKIKCHTKTWTICLWTYKNKIILWILYNIKI